MAKSRIAEGMTDEQWMRHVLRLAKRGRGRTSPNPMVGAVVVKEGRIAGEGYHRGPGEAHAEIVALRQAGSEAKGATLYLNVEPCVHHGRTPPCSPIVVESGIRRVVIGMRDPNPLVNGKGVESLEQSGLEVRLGILEAECRKLNEAFCKYIVSKNPFVILKIAATLDGKISTRVGDSKWVSSEAARHRVHHLRNEVDGVVVGIETVIRDDPLLTARIRGGKDPYRIILDSRLRIPETAVVLRDFPSRTIIATTNQAPKDKIARLDAKGARILVLDSKDGRVNLRVLLAELGASEVMSLLVEGGARVNGGFLDEGLVDKIILFLAPKVMGDHRAVSMFEGKGIASLKEAVPLKNLRATRVGRDILIEGDVVKEPYRCSQAS